MKIVKMPFTKGTYILSHETLNSELTMLREWLDTTGKRQYKVIGVNMIEILNPSIETMFILRWCNDSIS